MLRKILMTKLLAAALATGAFAQHRRRGPRLEPR